MRIIFRVQFEGNTADFARTGELHRFLASFVGTITTIILGVLEEDGTFTHVADCRMLINLLGS